jgi:hypothetical protein
MKGLLAGVDGPHLVLRNVFTTRWLAQLVAKLPAPSSDRWERPLMRKADIRRNGNARNVPQAEEPDACAAPLTTNEAPGSVWNVAAMKRSGV